MRALELERASLSFGSFSYCINPRACCKNKSDSLFFMSDLSEAQS